MRITTVLIADDHPLFRRGLRSVIDDSGRFRVVAEAGDGGSAIQQIERHGPIVAIIDLAMPVKDGLAVVAWLAQNKPLTRAVIMTLYKERDYVDRAVALGAAGYLVKDDAQEEVLRCLDAVLEGDFYLSPSVGAPNPAPPAALDGTEAATVARLTPSQRSVLKLLADYRTSKQIAHMLAISPKTVENHRTNVTAALGLRGHNALLQFAVRNRAQL